MSHSETPQKSSKTPETKEKPKFKDLATLTEDAVLSIFDPDFKGVDDGQVEPYVPIPAPIGPRPNWREAVLDQLNPQFLKEEYGYGKGIIDSLPEPSEELQNEYIKEELSDDLQEGYFLGEHGRPMRPPAGRRFPKEMNRPITKAEEATLKAVMTEEDEIAFTKEHAAAEKADLELERDLRQRDVSQKGKWARILKQSRDWEAAQKQKNPNFKGVDDGG